MLRLLKTSWAVFVVAAISPCSAQQTSIEGTKTAPTWVKPFYPVLDLDFEHNRYYFKNGACSSIRGCLTGTGGGSATDLLPTSPAGQPIHSFPINTPRLIDSIYGSGFLVEESRTNYLPNSTSLTSGTTATLPSGTFTLWTNAEPGGSIQMGAGTATGCGTATATQGTTQTITITVGGNCTYTVTGTVHAGQLELNPGTVSAPTSLIVTNSGAVTRAGDVFATVFPPALAGQAFTVEASGVPLMPLSFATTQTLLQGDINSSNASRFDIDRGGPGGNTAPGLTISNVSQTTPQPPCCNPWQTGANGNMLFSGEPGFLVTAYKGFSASIGGNSSFQANHLVIGAGSAPFYNHPWDGIVRRIIIRNQVFPNTSTMSNTHEGS